MPDSNKIKYGLKNVYYAPITTLSDNNVPTYGTPVRWPGAVNLSLSPEGERSPFYADDIEYWVGLSNNGYSGTLESALIPEDFRRDILGDVTDGAGVQVENAKAEARYFALLFEFAGDVKATRHVLYKCTAARPNTEGSTKEASVSPATETIDITSTPIYDPTLDTDIVKARTNADTDDTAYAGWFEAVHLPQHVDGVRLNVHSATVAAEDTIDLVATTYPEGETVTWTSDGTSVATVSGGTVTGVSAGTATITASVTIGGETYSDTCVVTVTAE